MAKKEIIIEKYTVIFENIENTEHIIDFLKKLLKEKNKNLDYFLTQYFRNRETNYDLNSNIIKILKI
jgi:hypothetical protein